MHYCSVLHLKTWIDQLRLWYINLITVIVKEAMIKLVSILLPASRRGLSTCSENHKSAKRSIVRVPAFLIFKSPIFEIVSNIKSAGEDWLYVEKNLLTSQPSDSDDGQDWSINYSKRRTAMFVRPVYRWPSRSPFAGSSSQHLGAIETASLALYCPASTLETGARNHACSETARRPPRRPDRERKCPHSDRTFDVVPQKTVPAERTFASHI